LKGLGRHPTLVVLGVDEPGLGVFLPVRLLALQFRFDVAASIGRRACQRRTLAPIDVDEAGLRNEVEAEVRELGRRQPVEIAPRVILRESSSYDLLGIEVEVLAVRAPIGHRASLRVRRRLLTVPIGAPAAGAVIEAARRHSFGLP
jgi:hypothetical protein